MCALRSRYQSPAFEVIHVEWALQPGWVTLASSLMFVHPLEPWFTTAASWLSVSCSVKRRKRREGMCLKSQNSFPPSSAGWIPVTRSPSRKIVITGEYWEKCKTQNTQKGPISKRSGIQLFEVNPKCQITPKSLACALKVWQISTDCHGVCADKPFFPTRLDALVGKAKV